MHLLNTLIETQLAERSLSAFVRQAWDVITPDVDYAHGDHIDAICEHLEAISRGDIRKLIVNVPPRHGKSTITAVCWPAWTWIHRPHLRWLFASYAGSLSTRDSVFCRDLIRSAWYQERWGERFKLKHDANQKTEFYNDKGGYRVATSVGGTATGKGGDILCVDDPHSLNEVYSDVRRRAAIRWWQTTMSTRVNDRRKSGRVVMMQRVHTEDVTGHCLEQPGWVHLRLPQRYDGNTDENAIGWSDWRTREGELLWPDRVGESEDVELRGELGSMDSSAQLDQRPVIREGGAIKRSWLRYYSELPADVKDFRQSWDLAFKDKQTSDYVAGQVWARDGARYYLIDAINERLDIVGTMAAIAAMRGKHPSAVRTLVEDKANGPAVMQMLRSSISGLTPWPKKGIRHPGKSERVHAVAPLFEAGNVFLPNPQTTPWLLGYVEQLCDYPAVKYDDQVDATTQALLDYTQGKRGVAFA